MKNLIKIAGAAAVVLASSQAYAQTATGDVIFNGSILNTCTIDNITPGTLAATTSNTVLSSRTADGGSAGTAEVTANSDIFDVSVDAPTAFEAGAPAGASANFVADYTGSGATTIAQTSGATDLSEGQTDISVNLVATSTGGAFPTGAYQAIVVLRCE